MATITLEEALRLFGGVSIAPAEDKEVPFQGRTLRIRVNSGPSFSFRDRFGAWEGQGYTVDLTEDSQGDNVTWYRATVIDDEGEIMDRWPGVLGVVHEDGEGGFFGKE